jgi:predicted enzyme related to lactoylglutathione lyase
MKRLLNWVEIPAANLQRAKSFYEHILDVQMQVMTVGDSEYALFPTEDQFNSGALVRGPRHTPSADGVVLFLDGGPDMSTILARVTGAGGHVLLEKTYMGDMAGHVGVFTDSEGNRIGLQHM